MTTYVFIIRTLTNLHAGSGDAGGYGVVDKLVQRDPVNNLPTIHASGIKGALREYFTEEQPIDSDPGRNKLKIAEIFGSDPKDRDEKNIQRGGYRFFDADLLVLPKPDHAADKHFQLVHDAQNTAFVQNKLTTLGASGLSLTIPGSVAGNLTELADELPVIARNYLDNGISKNLWYEEVAPRESVFVTCFQAPDAVLAEALHDKVVQLGGNATVGYGFCLFTQISPKPSPKNEKAS